MKQLLEFLPLVLRRLPDGRRERDCWRLVTYLRWHLQCHRIVDGKQRHRLAARLRPVEQNDRRLMWMAIAVVVFGAATLVLKTNGSSVKPTCSIGCWRRCSSAPNS